MKFLKFLKKFSLKFRWVGALATTLYWAFTYFDHAWHFVRHMLM